MNADLKVEVINGVEYLVVEALKEDGIVSCPENVQVGDIFHGGGFLPRSGVERGRPERTLAIAQAERLAALEELACQKRVLVAGTNDASKLVVYQTKYETATAALAGQQQALELLAPEAMARGETPLELATLVKFLGDQWRGAGLMIDAAYQTHKAVIMAQTEIEAVDAYDFTSGWPV